MTLTAMGRPLLLSCLTNRIILITASAAFVVALIYGLSNGEPFISALAAAGGAAITLFLSWALGREIDPAHDWSAFAALPFIFIVSFVYGSPALLALLFLILTCRAINGSTGASFTVFDSATVLMIGILLFNNGLLISLPFLAAIFLLDALLKPSNRHQFIFALLAVLAYAGMRLFLYDAQLNAHARNFDLLTAAAFLALLVAAAYLIYAARRACASGDRGGLPLDKRRTCLAQVAAAVFILLETALRGHIAIVMLYPVFLVFIGAALYHFSLRWSAK